MRRLYFNNFLNDLTTIVGTNTRSIFLALCSHYSLFTASPFASCWLHHIIWSVSCTLLCLKIVSPIKYRDIFAHFVTMRAPYNAGKADLSKCYCADQFESSTSPPPGNPPGIWTFEDWLVQIPSPRGKKAVQMPHQLVLKYLSTKPISSSVKHFTRFSERDMP